MPIYSLVQTKEGCAKSIELGYHEWFIFNVMLHPLWTADPFGLTPLMVPDTGLG